MAPDIGVGRSYSKAASDPEEEEWQREQHSEAKPRWADCVGEELVKQEELEEEREERKQEEQFEDERQEAGEEKRRGTERG